MVNVLCIVKGNVCRFSCQVMIFPCFSMCSNVISVQTKINQPAQLDQLKEEEALNINGVLTGFSCTFIEENKDFLFIYTLYDLKVISVVDSKTSLVTPLWANLKWKFKLEWAREQDTADVACGK